MYCSRLSQKEGNKKLEVPDLSQRGCGGKLFDFSDPHFLIQKIRMAVITTMCIRAKSLQSCLTLCNRMAPLSMGFSRQEYWSGLPGPPPGDLPDPEIEPVSLQSPTLAGGYLPLEPSGKPYIYTCMCMLFLERCCASQSTLYFC